MNEMARLRRKRQLLVLALLFGFTLIFLGTMEWVARWMGRTPYKLFPVKVAVEPGERLYQAHPNLGYTHLPGKFKVSLPNDYSFEVTHLTNTLRATHPADWPLVNRPAVWVMGGAYVYGWSLNDADTLPWQLQLQLAGNEVHNFGVNGYGTLQSLLQFREFLPKMPKPACVVMEYAFFHDASSAWLRRHGKELAPYRQLGMVSQPWARLSKTGVADVFPPQPEYQPWPWQTRSALLHVFEDRYCQWEDRRVHSQQVSIALLNQFAAECKAKDIAFVVAITTSGHESGVVLLACTMAGIRVVDISVNLSKPGNRNTPYDDSPSARTQAEYARKLGDYLTTKVLLPKPLK